MFRVAPYNKEFKTIWDQFVTRSKNGVFLFHRDYMEYHADRFTDHSLLFYEDDELFGLMPANLQGDTLISHGGLTFGGIISDVRMKTPRMLELVDVLAAYLQLKGIVRLVYKAVPHIYHTLPAEEDLYALFRHDARLIRRDVSSTIDYRARAPLLSGRVKGLKRAQKLAAKSGVTIRRSQDFETFMTIESEVLAERHNAKPVHTAGELALLAGRFPDNIELYAACHGERMIAGVIMYVSTNVAHTQYIAANDEGRECGALDLIFDTLINERYVGNRYFDFGISTEQDGRMLNTGLIEYKAGFGARATVHDFYEMRLD
jgi:hypothetical protein